MSRKAYSFLRDSVLTLPRPSYLLKICAPFSVKSDFDNSDSNLKYLKAKASSMSSDERRVTLLVDEINTDGKFTYSGGKIFGSASNCPLSSSAAVESNTAQVFMITSLLSYKKDVAAIVPVLKQDCDCLFSLLKIVLKQLHDAGFIVQAIISDNLSVNTKAFSLFGNGTVPISIDNPYKDSEKLFFFYDLVHVFKSVRNNWLGQMDSQKTIRFCKFNHDPTLIDVSSGSEVNDKQ